VFIMANEVAKQEEKAGKEKIAEIVKAPQKEKVKEEIAKQQKQEKEKLKEIEQERLEKEKLLEISQISLWLDDYDDIFSDFDPRPYSQRALSDDFLQEVKRASHEIKEKKIELKFLIPEKERTREKEFVIKRRLREHFRRHAKLIEQEIKQLRKKSLLLVLAGCLLMMVATFIAYHEFKNFLFYFLIILFEPAGWFSVWYGLDQFFYTAREKSPDLKFNKKLAKAEIGFISY